jgi:hypothetical protein
MYQAHFLAIRTSLSLCIPALFNRSARGPVIFKGYDPVPLRGDLERLLQGTGLLSTENLELDELQHISQHVYSKHIEPLFSLTKVAVPHAFAYPKKRQVVESNWKWTKEKLRASLLLCNIHLSATKLYFTSSTAKLRTQTYTETHHENFAHYSKTNVRGPPS